MNYEITMENKNSFFMMRFPIEKSKNNEFYIGEIINGADLIMATMGVKEQWFRYDHKTRNEIVYLFQTDLRKRKGQLVKECDKIMPKEQDYDVQGLTKSSFETEIQRLKKNEYFELKDKFNKFEEYTGEDVKMFNDLENWRSWQKIVYQKIFDTWPPKKGQIIQKANQRKIINIIDFEGNSGKSTYFKWLFCQHPEKIAKMTYGTSAQLRTSLINVGVRQVYIFDLVRAKGKEDREEDLLAAIEDCKNGFVLSNMYGGGKSLIMEPPHIIISCNYILNFSLLSNDRWEIYQLKKIRNDYVLKEVKSTQDFIGLNSDQSKYQQKLKLKKRKFKESIGGGIKKY